MFYRWHITIFKTKHCVKDTHRCLIVFSIKAGLKSYSFIAWEPTDVEVEILRQNPKRRKVENKSTIGKLFTYHIVTCPQF